MTQAHINVIATAVPKHEVHNAFVCFAERMIRDRRARFLFRRMADRSEIHRRWSCLPPARSDGNEGGALDLDGLYFPGRFPSTAARMAIFEAEAAPLALRAVDGLGVELSGITHLIVASCTGFAAPGPDLELIREAGLPSSVERTFIGFMGCNAAINSLKIAHHIVRSEPGARVLLVCLELCTIHLQETDSLEQLLAFLLFGDGCAAALISGDPTGIAIDAFHAELAQNASDHITWRIRDGGFEMMLSGHVPAAITTTLRSAKSRILKDASPDEIKLWAVHPGGRTVLDAVDDAFALGPEALATSRCVLRDFGNMSSASVLFVLDAMMRERRRGRGCAMAFGPGLCAETMLFHTAE